MKSIFVSASTAAPITANVIDGYDDYYFDVIAVKIQKCEKMS